MERFRNHARLIRNLRTAYKPVLPFQAHKPDYHLIPITDATGVMVAQVRLEHIDYDCKEPGSTRQLIDGAQQRAKLFAAAPELLDQAELFARTLEYLIKRDRNNGDEEGANLKTTTLYILNQVIQNAKGQ